MNGPVRILVLGDIIAILILTLIGFATHGTLGDAGARILTTFIPMLLGWAAAAPFLGVYQPERALEMRSLWRPAWAMALAAPLAAWIRGVWLNAPIVPIFVLVLSGTGILGILLWRVVYLFMARRRNFLDNQKWMKPL